jgi:hypothetical protein
VTVLPLITYCAATPIYRAVTTTVLYSIVLTDCLSVSVYVSVYVYVYVRACGARAWIMGPSTWALLSERGGQAKGQGKGRAKGQAAERDRERAGWARQAELTG